MIIKTIGLEGAALLAAIHQEAFEKKGEVWDESSLGQLMSLPGVTAWLALQGDEPLGFLLTRTVCDESEVLTFAVRPAHQRRGVGVALFKYFLNFVKGSVKFIYLEVSITNSAAISFYKTCSFHEVGHRAGYYRDGSDAILLRYSL